MTRKEFFQLYPKPYPPYWTFEYTWYANGGLKVLTLRMSGWGEYASLYLTHEGFRRLIEKGWVAAGTFEKVLDRWERELLRLKLEGDVQFANVSRVTGEFQ